MKELNGEIKALDARVGGFESKVEGEFKAAQSKMRRLDEKIDSLDKRLETKIDGLDKRMEVTQRVAVIEQRMRELETKR